MDDYSKAAQFFTPAEKEAIEATIRKVEADTQGEIAVMVVDASSRYREAEVFGGITVGNIAAFLVVVLFLQESLWWYVPLTLVFFYPSWFIFRKLPALTIYFAGPARREEAVARRAILAFYEKGLYKTTGNTGVLFFISLLEHKVWVLADEGIYKEISQAKLQEFAQVVSQGIREGRGAEALVRAIHDVGEILRKHFPLQAGDKNELPDAIMTEGYPQET